MGKDISLVEGNLGLHDGIDLYGQGSTAHLAKILKAPVVLVVDCRGMNRGIAPLILGYKQFDPSINIVGLVLNQVRGKRHESKLREAIDHYCNIEVLGVIPADIGLEIPERHLGLTPIEENTNLIEVLNKIGTVVSNSVQCDRILEIAKIAPELDNFPEQIVIHEKKRNLKKVKIGIALDQAFHFYYPENKEALEEELADLIPINTLEDRELPQINGLYIGGGFPEVFMEKLEKNISLRKSIRNAIEKGLPVYAECGGLMYLGESITWKGDKRKMVSALPLEFCLSEKPKGLGYMFLKTTGESQWLNIDREVIAHEFHHSSATIKDKTLNFAYQLNRGAGITGELDGIIYKNVIASYAHLHSLATPEWAVQFVNFVRKIHFQT